MKNNIFKLSLFALISTCLLFTSCSKEELFSSFKGDSDAQISVEAENTFEANEFILNINGRTFTTNAYAEYCVDPSGSFLAVSNKQVLLDTTMNLSDFAEDDFVFHQRIEPGNTYTLGGAVFGSATTGVPNLLQAIFSTDPVVNITSNNGTVVDGTMSGTFMALDTNYVPSIPLPYTANFSAQIIQQSVLCPF